MSGILLATHGSATSDGAVQIAASLAQRTGTTVTALCVLEPLRVVDGGYAAAYVASAEEDEAVHASLRAAVADQLRRCGLAANILLRTGSPPSEIADAAREMKADIIVLGLGRHHLFERVMGNETALQLVQLASTPILAVPPEMTKLPHRVVAAIDFSPTSIASAKSFAQLLVGGDVLHLVYSPGEWHGGYPIEQRIMAENVLTSVAQQIDPPSGVKIEQSVVEGEPAASILQSSATTGAEMIVLGSHGYGFWKRLAIGSVASKIVRISNIAVFVTPNSCPTVTSMRSVASARSVKAH